MSLVSFDPFRTLSLPGVRYIKPEAMHQHLGLLSGARWLLFPEYWQIHTLHYVLKRPIFPSLSTYHLGHDKVEMTRAFQAACPAHIPRTDICPNLRSHQERILDTYAFPFVAKKVRASMGLGVYLIDDAAAFYRYAAENDILYVQEYLPIRRDLRLVLAGARVVHGYWREGDDFLNNVSRGARIRDDLPVPEVAVNFVETLAAYLDINYAGFDVAMVDGVPMLFEFNRLFGNQQRPELFRQVGVAMRDYLLGPPPTPGSSASLLA